MSCVRHLHQSMSVGKKKKTLQRKPAASAVWREINAQSRDFSGLQNQSNQTLHILISHVISKAVKPLLLRVWKKEVRSPAWLRQLRKDPTCRLRLQGPCQQWRILDFGLISLELGAHLGFLVSSPYQCCQGIQSPQSTALHHLTFPNQDPEGEAMNWLHPGPGDRSCLHLANQRVWQPRGSSWPWCPSPNAWVV